MTLQQIRGHIENRPMLFWQWMVVAVGVLVNMLDGFDLLADSLVAPILTREWHLEHGILGLLLGASALGTAIGAFALSAIADLRGRRSAILINLVLMSIGMLASATADSVQMLIALRFLTGMGVGAMAGCVGTLIFEYSAVRSRNLALGLVVIGYTVGVVIGGYIARAFLGHLSWSALFVLGGALTLVLIPLVYFALPESLEFLAARPKPDTLPRFNRYLRHLRLPAVEALPAPLPKAATSSVLDLLRPPILSRQALMGASYFLYMFSSYFFLKWNNQLTTEAGFSDAGGLSISILTNLGGIAGGVLIGWLSSRLHFRGTATVTLIAMGVAIAAFGGAASSFAFTVACSMLIGFSIFGAAVVLYAAGTATFPARVRATGMGLSMGAGRGGSFLGPVVAGLLLQAGLGRLATCLLLAVPVIASAFVLRRVPLAPLPDE
ncbi:MAG TPA: MFS transporter [Steroidobacteraceae bacterium]|nr:MFS transporter [Steroidobacteraceae bacterium]